MKPIELKYNLNIQHFNDPEPNPEPQSNGDKTFTQDEVNTFVAGARKEAETKRKLAVSTEQKAKEYATKHPDVVADLISAWVKEGGNGNKQ